MVLRGASTSKQPEIGRGFIGEEVEQVLTLKLLLGALPVTLYLLTLGWAAGACRWGPAAARGSP